MENQEQDVNLESSPEKVVEVEETPTETVPDKSIEKPVEKVVPYSRFKEVNDKLKDAKQPKIINQALDVEDYINISASLDGLDKREKEYLAQQHKFTGKSLNELRESEDFKFWQDSYRSKVEREKSSLAPSTTQPEETRQTSLEERLASASLEEKEKVLTEMGLFKQVRPRPDRTDWRQK